jgi:hypothetical protein
MRGAGRATFAAIPLLIAGTLNMVYGIGALDSANSFANEKRFILDDVNRMGWVLGSLGAIGDLFSIGGANPWWSLAIFLLCVWVVYGIVVLGDDGASYEPEPHAWAET